MDDIKNQLKLILEKETSLRMLDHYLSSLPNFREEIFPQWKKSLENILKYEEEDIDEETEALLWKIFRRGEAQEAIADVMINKVYAFRIIRGQINKMGKGRFCTPSTMKLNEALLTIMQALPFYEEKLLPHLNGKKAVDYYKLWKKSNPKKIII